MKLTRQECVLIVKALRRYNVTDDSLSLSDKIEDAILFEGVELPYYVSIIVEKTLNESKSILDSTGYVAITVNNYQTLKNLRDELQDKTLIVNPL